MKESLENVKPVDADKKDEETELAERKLKLIDLKDENFDLARKGFFRSRDFNAFLEKARKLGLLERSKSKGRIKWLKQRGHNLVKSIEKEPYAYTYASKKNLHRSIEGEVFQSLPILREKALKNEERDKKYRKHETYKQEKRSESYKENKKRTLMVNDKVQELIKQNLFFPDDFDAYVETLENYITAPLNDDKMAMLKKKQEKNGIVRTVESLWDKKTYTTQHTFSRYSFEGQLFQSLPKLREKAEQAEKDRRIIRPRTEKQKKLVARFDKLLKHPRKLFENLLIEIKQDIRDEYVKPLDTASPITLLWNYKNELNQAIIHEKDVKKAQKLIAQAKKLGVKNFSQSEFQQAILPQAKKAEIVTLVSKNRFSPKEKVRKIKTESNEFKYRHWEKRDKKTYLYIDVYKRSRKTKVDRVLSQELQWYAQLIEPLEGICWLMGEPFQELLKSQKTQKKIKRVMRKEPTVEIETPDSKLKKKKKTKKTKPQGQTREFKTLRKKEGEDWKDQLARLKKQTK